MANGDTAAKVADIGLTSYQVEAFKFFTERKDFKGARVLEIGGHDLPPELKFEILGARKWHSIDIIAHGTGNYQRYVPYGDADPGPVPLSEVKRPHFDLPSLFINGDIAEIGQAFDRQYDICVSICAFEHINIFPVALENIFRCLALNGSLLSYFGPIWSCFCGHHFYYNETINFNKLGPIGHHDHLLRRQPEMYGVLVENGYSARDASTIVDQIYCTRSVNRLFYEDYVEYLEKSGFTGFSHRPYGVRPIPEDRRSALELRYPGYKRFDAYGMMINAWKTG